MKIGVLTFHQSINDGAVLQCYSLCKRLKHEFPNDSVEVIDYRMPKVNSHYNVSLKKYLFKGRPIDVLRKSLILLLQPRLIQQMKERNEAFESCLDILPLSTRCILDDGVDELFKYIQENYDVVVAGSDAIWNYRMRGFPNPYFLSNSIHIPKLAYAASCHGMNYERIPVDEKEEIGELLNSYAFIGVRDEESANFVRTVHCTVPTLHTCDPTVFLDVDDLPVNVEELKKKMKRRGFDFRKVAIAVMGGNQMCRMVRKMYANSSYQIVALHTPSIYADVNLHDLSPYEWGYAFHFFNITFTTFFHGTLVSLRNGTPVIALSLETEYSKNHTTKVEDFLKRIGMEDCYFHTDYHNDGIKKIKQKTDQLLKDSNRKQILIRMDKEAQSAVPFIEKIRQLKNEGEYSCD